jgi:beta-lactam-binding protein with PASTA domain
MRRIAINIVILILLVFLTFWGISFYLSSITNHGESITVPNLTGIDVIEAKEILNQKSLIININDSTYNPKFSPLAVVDQNPKPESKVKEGRNIYVTINSTKVPMVKVPAIKDLSYRSGVAQLSNSRLYEGNISYKNSDFKDVILEYSYKGKMLKEGDKVPVNSFIDIVLGDGESSSSVEVPDLVGRNLEEAIIIIKGNKLVVGQVFTDDMKQIDSSSSVVSKQSPLYGNGNSVPKGTAINLWLERFNNNDE